MGRIKKKEALSANALLQFLCHARQMQKTNFPFCWEDNSPTSILQFCVSKSEEHEVIITLSKIWHIIWLTVKVDWFILETRSHNWNFFHVRGALSCEAGCTSKEAFGSFMWLWNKSEVIAYIHQRAVNYPCTFSVRTWIKQPCAHPIWALFLYCDDRYQKKSICLASPICEGHTCKPTRFSREIPIFHCPLPVSFWRHISPSISIPVILQQIST